MSKKPPLVPRKEEYQGKTEEQTQDSNTLASIAVIGLLVTLLGVIINEIILWISK